MPIDELIHILQGSIAPCILISGVGLLITAMSTRLSRASELIRRLCKDLDPAPKDEKENIKNQIRILYSRCKYLQSAIFFAASTIFFVSLVVLMLFFTFVFSLSFIPFIKISFGLSLICLATSLVLFLFDIRATLSTLKMALAKYGVLG